MMCWQKWFGCCGGAWVVAVMVFGISSFGGASASVGASSDGSLASFQAISPEKIQVLRYDSVSGRRRAWKEIKNTYSVAG